MKEVLLTSDAGGNNEKNETAEQPEVWEKIQQTEAVRFLDISPETEAEIKNNPELKKLLGEIIDHDEGTFEHSLRMADLARELNEKGNLGLEERGKETFFTAALLHDIGKIYVDKEILNKPAALTEKENAEMDRHVTEGIEHLKGKIPEDLYEPIALIIGSHHKERDRRGKKASGNNEKDQRKKFGQETEKIIRLISIIDEFDSLLYERPYKEAMPINNVRELLREKFGQEADGEIIDLLYNYKGVILRSYQKKQIKVMNSPWHKQETKKDLGHEPERSELAQHFLDKKYSKIFSKRNKYLRADIN